jgi:glutamate---cysteine ligase / carboxylate-amine ligase
MPQAFASRAEYDRLVETLMATGSVREPTKLYWDVRPSARQETLEFRVADVCMGVDEAVMVAGLARACHDAAARGDGPRPELLRAAKWRAARHGLDADLVDAPAGRARPASGRCSSGPGAWRRSWTWSSRRPPAKVATGLRRRRPGEPGGPG